MHGSIFSPSANSAIKSAIDDAVREMRDEGVIAGAYFLTPAFHAPIGPKTVIATFGLVPDAEKRLTSPAFLADDPFPDFVMAAARPMTWHEVLAEIDLTGTQRQFVDFLRAHGLEDALSVPLFGPDGCDSYSVYIFDRTLTEADAALKRRIIEIAQAMHIEVCTLAGRNHPEAASLSKRETEVLRWMAHGKSNVDIATILGLAVGTVDTFVRRIFSKLQVNDRISAVLAGISGGHVQL